MTWSWVVGSLHVLYKQVLSLYEGVAGLPSAWQSGLLVPAHQVLVTLSLHCDNRKHSQQFPKPSLGGAARFVENHWLICMEARAFSSLFLKKHKSWYIAYRYLIFNTFQIYV